MQLSWRKISIVNYYCFLFILFSYYSGFSFFKSCIFYVYILFYVLFMFLLCSFYDPFMFGNVPFLRFLLFTIFFSLKFRFFFGQFFVIFWKKKYFHTSDGLSVDGDFAFGILQTSIWRFTEHFHIAASSAVSALNKYFLTPKPWASSTLIFQLWSGLPSAEIAS